MNSLEGQPSRVTELDDDLVLQFLLQNPDFFIRNARSVEKLSVPHAVKGSVSLVEWQMGRQRSQLREQEQEITALMEQATANEILLGRIIELLANLSAAGNLQNLLDRLQRWARSIGLAGVHIRLFPERWRIGAPSDFTHLTLMRNAFEPVRIQRFGNGRHFLGNLNGQEQQLLLPDVRQVGSVALSLMGEHNDLGVLIFYSRDKEHYQPNMGTVMLNQLANIFPILLERWLERV
jgi:uncharacterized protein YigA (DUF484 family)